MENSCLMLSLAFHTSIDIYSLLDKSDIMEDGIERNPHITLLYAKDKEDRISKEDILPSIRNILGDDEYLVFLEILKDNYKFKVSELFELSKFDNGASDYLILRMKENNEMFKVLSKINKGLMEKYNVISDFDSYKPHMTIAELVPGAAVKYVSDEKFKLSLSDSKVGFEDLVISYGSEYNKLWSITTYHTVERLFRD